MILKKNKNIGHVLFIVEGERHEFTILKRVFVKILDYQMIGKRRNKTEYYQSKLNRHNVIAVINTETSNIKSIQDENGFLDKIYEDLIESYNFNLSNAAIYYLFDRDKLSNTDHKFIRSLLELLRNSRENENNIQGGILLINYPSIEAYEISNFIEDAFSLNFQLGKELKAYINDNSKKISINKINEDTIAKAADVMMKYFNENGINLDLDDIGESNLKIYDTQEKYYENNSKYSILSLLSIALLDLGMLIDD